MHFFYYSNSNPLGKRKKQRSQTHWIFNLLCRRNLVFRTDINQIRDIIGLFDRCKGLQIILTLITKTCKFAWLWNSGGAGLGQCVSQAQWVEAKVPCAERVFVRLSVCLFAGEQLIVVETTESDFPGVDSVDRVLCALDLPVTQPPAPSMRSRPLVNTRPAVPSRWRGKSSFYTLRWCNAVC